MNSEPSSPTPATPSSERTLSLYLPGYLPPSMNEMLGMHWRHKHGERVRAADALEAALRFELRSEPDVPATGTTGPLSRFRTALSTLVSWRVTDGIYSKGKSSRKRLTRSTRKGPSSS